LPKKGRRIGVYTYIDPKDFEKLSDMSRETGISISSLVRKAVKDMIRRETARN